MTMKLSFSTKARVSSSRRKERKKRKGDDLHVENRSSGHISHSPSSLVVLHRRIHRVHEVPDDRNSPFPSREGSLLSAPAHLKEEREEREDGESARARLEVVPLSSFRSGSLPRSHLQMLLNLCSSRVEPKKSG